MTLSELQAAGADRVINETEVILGQIIEDYNTALKAVLSDLESLYAKTLAGVKPEDYYNTVIQYDRLTKLQKQIEEKIAYYTKLADKKILEASSLAMTNNYYQTLYGFQWVGPEAGVDISFSMLPKELVEASVLNTPEAWKAVKKTIADKYGPLAIYQAKHGTLTDILLRNNYDAANKVRQAISAGMARGASYKEIAAEVTKIIGEATGTEASGLMANAVRIVRTETIRLLNDGALASAFYAESLGLNVKKEWVATLDAETRASHADLDGQRVELTEPFRLGTLTAQAPGGFGVAAQDINCRCGIIEVIDDVSPKLRRARIPVVKDGKIVDEGKYDIISYKYYNEWLAENGLKRSASGRVVPI